MDQGSVGIPGGNAGALAAEKYINAELGGINGHALVISVCHAGLDPQSNQACGQQFANDPDIHLVNAGWMFNGGTFYSALAPTGKAVLGTVPLTAADFASQTIFWSVGQLIQRSFIGLALLKAPNLKKLGVFNEDNAVGQASLTYMQAALKSDDPSGQIVLAKVEPGSTDLVGAATQLGNVDAYVVNLNGPGCIQALQALQSVAPGKPLVADQACADGSVVSAVGNTAVDGLSFASLSELTNAPSGLSADAMTFNQEYPKYGDPKYLADPFAAEEWGMLLSLRTALAGLSDAQLTSNAALLNAITTFKGPVILGAPTLSCPGVLEKQVCATSVLGYVVTDGKPVRASGTSSVINVTS